MRRLGAWGLLLLLAVGCGVVGEDADGDAAVLLAVALVLGVVAIFASESLIRRRDSP